LLPSSNGGPPYKYAKTENNINHLSQSRTMAEEQRDEEDIYKQEDVEQELEDDEIKPGEAGFMEGYDKGLNKEKQKKKSRK
jgi:hypothetical protein